MSAAPMPRGKMFAELRDLCLHYGLRSLPAATCSGIGAWCGNKLGQNGHPNAAARARALLPRLRPDLAMTPEALDANLHILWENVGRTYAEFASLDKIIAEGRSVLSDPDQLAQAVDTDQPVIVCFVHLGNWEVLGHQCGATAIALKRPVAAVVMPPANRAHAHIAAKRRATLGFDLVPMSPRVWAAVAELLRRPRGTAWIAADEVANGRVYAPHFGRQLRIDGNLGKIVRLAAATGARILPAYSERIGTLGFRSHIMPFLDMPKGRLSPAEIIAHVMRLDALFAPIVQRHLTQWYMAIEFGLDSGDPIVSPYSSV